jgi:hypothetical protein
MLCACRRSQGARCPRWACGWRCALSLGSGLVLLFTDFALARGRLVLVVHSGLAAGGRLVVGRRLFSGSGLLAGSELSLLES